MGCAGDRTSLQGAASLLQRMWQRPKTERNLLLCPWLLLKALNWVDTFFHLDGYCVVRPSLPLPLVTVVPQRSPARFPRIWSLIWHRTGSYISVPSDSRG